MPASQVSINLALSYDQRGVAAFTNMDAGKDQRRLNGIYKITRPSVGAPPDVVLCKRAGASDAGLAALGASTQEQYLIGNSPDSKWDLVPWAIVKDSNDNKVVTEAGSQTILTSASYFPRFFRTIRLVVAGIPTNYAVVSFQNTSSPGSAGAIRVFYASVYNSWLEISDTDFTGLTQVGGMEQMDGYLFQGTAEGRIYQSGVNSIGDWATNDFLTRTIAQDPAQGIAKHRNQILFFGLATVEVFTNQGSTTGTVIQRVPFSTQDVGLANVAGGGAGLTGKTEYYCAIGDLMFFLGRFGRGTNDTSLIAYDGRRFEKVSRPAEDGVLSSTTVYGVHKISHHGLVGVACQLTPPTDNTQKGVVFFPELNDWFEWSSPVWGFANNGVHYAGCGNTQKLYKFNQADNWQDAGTDYDLIVQFRLPLPDLTWTTMSMCGVIADTTSASRNLGVQFSDDDGVTWSTARNIDLANLYKILTQCGGFRQRMVRLTISGNAEGRLRKFFTTLHR